MISNMRYKVAAAVCLSLVCAAHAPAREPMPKPIEYGTFTPDESKVEILKSKAGEMYRLDFGLPYGQGPNLYKLVTGVDCHYWPMRCRHPEFVINGEHPTVSKHPDHPDHIAPGRSTWVNPSGIDSDEAFVGELSLYWRSNEGEPLTIWTLSDVDRYTGRNVPYKIYNWSAWLRARESKQLSRDKAEQIAKRERDKDKLRREQEIDAQYVAPLRKKYARELELQRETAARLRAKNEALENKPDPKPVIRTQIERIPHPLDERLKQMLPRLKSILIILGFILTLCFIRYALRSWREESEAKRIQNKETANRQSREREARWYAKGEQAERDWKQADRDVEKMKHDEFMRVMNKKPGNGAY